MTNDSALPWISENSGFAPVVVPVGFYNGERWLNGEVTYEVMLPNAAAQLPPDAHAVRLAAVTDIEAIADLRFTRADLIGFCERLGISDVPEIVGNLFESGLLVEFDPAAPDDFYTRYRLHPTADALGNSEDRPTVFRIAREGRILFEVNVHVLGVWSTSVYSSSLAAGIAKYAAAVDIPAVEIGRRLALSLPALVANSCGFLQPASPVGVHDDVSSSL